jgi:hypothetical protein
VGELVGIVDRAARKDAGDGHAGAWRDRPAGLTVVDPDSVEQLQARFNADRGVPRLVAEMRNH